MLKNYARFCIHYIELGTFTEQDIAATAAVVVVEVLRDVSAGSILNLTVKSFRRGSIVYRDIFKSI